MLTAVASLAGMTTYLLFTWFFKVEEVTLLFNLFRKLKIKKGAEIAATSTIGLREEIE